MKRWFISVVVLILAIGSAGCKTMNPNPNVSKLSPEGKAAYYGNIFLEGVEKAQQQTAALVGTSGITKADVQPAMDVYLQIGKGGQDFAHALRAIDQSNVTSADKQAAALRAREAVDAFEGSLRSLTVRVDNPAVRAKVDAIINTLKLGMALLDVVQRIAPFLPATPTPVAVPKTQAWMGGFAYAC